MYFSSFGIQAEWAVSSAVALSLIEQLLAYVFKPLFIQAQLTRHDGSFYQQPCTLLYNFTPEFWSVGRPFGAFAYSVEAHCWWSLKHDEVAYRNISPQFITSHSF